MAEQLNYAAMWQCLVSLQDKEKYAAFLREQSRAGDHSFLLAEIDRSNLHPSIRKVVRDVITRKLRRPKHRPRADDRDMTGAIRALRVLDIEKSGQLGPKRDAAIREAAKQLHCSYSTVEKAIHKYEGVIKGLNPELLDRLRSAFK
jgi:hypothetical protein